MLGRYKCIFLLFKIHSDHSWQKYELIFPDLCGKGKILHKACRLPGAQDGRSQMPDEPAGRSGYRQNTGAISGTPGATVFRALFQRAGFIGKMLQGQQPAGKSGRIYTGLPEI